MKGLPAELIYILLIGGVLLFNHFMQQAARRRQAEMEQDEAPQEAPPQDALDEDIWARAPLTATALPEPAAYVEPVHRSTSPTASPAAARRRFSKQSLMGTRRDVQNAVVIAAILGPCRAFEPHDKQ